MTRDEEKNIASLGRNDSYHTIDSYDISRPWNERSYKKISHKNILKLYPRRPKTHWSTLFLKSNQAKTSRIRTPVHHEDKNKDQE